MKICGVQTKNLNLIIQFLDSLVVRISACHVEGPGSIPGRGGNFFSLTKFSNGTKNIWLLGGSNP